MKVMKLIKTCLRETYSRVRVSKHLSEMFPVKNGLRRGDALSLLLFNFAVEYAIRRVQVNQYGLKLNGTHQFPVYVDTINILGGIVHTVKGNTEAYVVASKEFGLPVNTENNKYLVMSRDQNAGRNRNVKNDNVSFERVEELKYLGTSLTYQNSVEQEIKRGLKSWNACCHSVQNHLSSSLLSKNINNKIHRIKISLVVLWV
jgi:hypothetical protein